MGGWAEKLFYTLSAVVLGSAFFVLQPNPHPEVALFQNQVKNEFVFATTQVIGDQPIFGSVEIVISAVHEFYFRSAEVMITLLTPPPSTEDTMWIAGEVYDKFAMAFTTGILKPQVLGVENKETVYVPENFMIEEPIINIIPPQALFVHEQQPVVLSASTETTHAVNDDGYPWVNLRDNSTGQVYCVAIFNSEVNRYLGPCKNDYH